MRARALLIVISFIRMNLIMRRRSRHPLLRAELVMCCNFLVVAACKQRTCVVVGQTRALALVRFSIPVSICVGSEVVRATFQTA